MLGTDDPLDHGFTFLASRSMPSRASTRSKNRRLHQTVSIGPMYLTPSLSEYSHASATAFPSSEHRTAPPPARWGRDRICVLG